MIQSDRVRGVLLMKYRCKRDVKGAVPYKFSLPTLCFTIHLPPFHIYDLQSTKIMI